SPNPTHKPKTTRPATPAGPSARPPTPSPNSYDTLDRVRTGVFEYIEIYYNRQRIHSAIGYLTPVEYEEKFDRQVLRVA
ncbi:IS3 family transposase, partial [Frankia sp. BMG5.23]|uniref:IS3 family transposase n=1 Tax=Frankia sp. BMG5.23 TaxID=683305 RepID=UPI0004616B6C